MYYLWVIMSFEWNTLLPSRHTYDYTSLLHPQGDIGVIKKKNPVYLNVEKPFWKSTEWQTFYQTSKKHIKNIINMWKERLYLHWFINTHVIEYVPPLIEGCLL